jgi:hypothetical protein
MSIYIPELPQTLELVAELESGKAGVRVLLLSTHLICSLLE